MEEYMVVVTGTMISDIFRSTIPRESGSTDICNHEFGWERWRREVDICRRFSERNFEHSTTITALIVAMLKLVSGIRKALHHDEH